MELIQGQELAARIEAGAAPTIIDVRSRWEFERGHIPGARHFPFWNIKARANELAVEKTGDIVVYCGHGPRAQWASAALRRCGFERVVLLDGHWASWVREGRPQQ